MSTGPVTDFYTHINLRGNQLLNAVIQRSDVPPSGARAGQLYFNTVENALYVLGTDGNWERLLGLDYAVRRGFGPNEDYKPSVRVATTVADLATASYVYNSTTGVLTISSLPAGAELPRLDGVELQLGDRVLVKDLPAEPVDLRHLNGIWQVRTGSTATSLVLVRTPDANSSDLVTPGMLVPVDRGATQATYVYQLVNEDVTLGVTPLVFRRIRAEEIYRITALGPGLEFTSPNSIGLAGVTALGAGALLVGSTPEAFRVLLPPAGAGVLVVDSSGEVTWHPAPLSVAYGGTGVSTVNPGGLLVGSDGNTFAQLLPGAVGSYLVVDPAGRPMWRARKHVEVVDGSDSAYVIAHRLGTTDVVVQLWDLATTPVRQLLADVEVLDDDRVRVVFGAVRGDVKVVVMA